MITIRGKQYKVIDAHAHVWDNYHGERFGDTEVLKIGSGMIRVGEKEMQFLPPEFEDYSVKIEVLEGYMRMAGVDKAVILQNPCYGDQRDYVGGIVGKKPGKFVSFGMIDPRNKDKVVFEIDELMDVYKNIGIKLEIPDVPFELDSSEYDFMWRHLMDKGGIVAMDLGWGSGPYDFNIERLKTLVKRYPSMKLVLCHLGVSRLWDLEQKHPYPELQKTLSLLDINKDNLYLDMAMVPMSNEADEYPFYRGQEIMRLVKEYCGMDRIMWGSDEPGMLIHCTYQQSLDFITKHCPFLTDSDLSKLLADNAEHFLFSK